MTSKSPCFASPFFVVVDGNIGVGKSSVLNYLKKTDTGLVTIQEPVEAYSHFSYDGQTFDPLACMYQKRAETGLIQDFIIEQSSKHYQTSMGRFFYPIMQGEEASEAVVCERTVLSAHPFISTYHQNGALSNFAAAYLHQKVDRLTHPLFDPNLVIFLDLPTSDARARIAQRKRVSEAEVDEFFLALLATNMLQFYRDLEARKKVPLIVIKLKAEWSVEKVAEKVSEVVKRCFAQWQKAGLQAEKQAQI